MKTVLALAAAFGVAMAVGRPPAEAPSGFDDKTNGVVDQATHDADREAVEDRVRTAALWGLRLRTRLMHDGESVTPADAIRRHRGEAKESAARFARLSPPDREAELVFLRSL